MIYIHLAPVVQTFDSAIRWIHRRTGRGGEEGCSPPNFGQLRFFGQQEKIWAKPGFKDVSMFFIIIILKR